MTDQNTAPPEGANPDNSLWYMSIPVTECDISVALANIFKREDIETLGDISRYTLRDFKAMRGFGAKRRDELDVLLNEQGALLQDELQNADLTLFRKKMGDSYWSRNDAMVARFKTDNQKPNDDPLHITAENRPWYFNIPVNELDISIRVYNDLTSLGVRTLGDFSKFTLAELAKRRGFGISALTQIRDNAHTMGLVLGDDLPQKSIVTERVTRGFEFWGQNAEMVTRFNRTGQKIDHILGQNNPKL